MGISNGFKNTLLVADDINFWWFDFFGPDPTNKYNIQKTCLADGLRKCMKCNIIASNIYEVFIDV